MGEMEVQKGLNYAALISLISIPITGVVGIVGVGAFLTTKFTRLGNENIYNKYKSEKKDLKELERDLKKSRELSSLLDRENERKSYESSLNNGRKMVEEYLSNLPTNHYNNINQIEIIEKDKTFFGFPTGNKSLEVKVK